MTAPVPGDEPLHKGVARTIGIEIVEGRLPTGAPMTLDTISARFTISRTVAREVVRTLEELRLVSSRRRVGITVLPRSEWNFLHPTTIDWRLHSSDRTAQLRSLSQLRDVVEPAAAAGAARHASVEARAMLPPLAAQMRQEGEAGRLGAFLALDMRFHTTLLTASGNELFAALAPLVEIVLAGRTELGLMPEVPKPEALDGHEAVADAVWRGDPDAARAAMSVITGEVRSVFDAA